MKKYLTIDIGGTYIKYGLATHQGDILEKGKIPTQRDDINIFLNDLDNIVNKYISLITAITISMPGKINVQEGVAITGGALRFINNTPLKKLLEKRYNLPVSIANDGHCAALAELWKGSLKDCQNGICIVFGTGIGGGVVVNHQIVEGTHFSSGELSCLITNYSCPDLDHFLGTRCSTRAILRKYTHLKNPDMTGYEFFKKVKEKEEKALIIYQNFLREVASTIYSIQSILDCDMVSIGGGISSVDFLIDDINQALDEQFKRYTGFPIERPKVVRCIFKNDANLIGSLKYYPELQAETGNKIKNF